MDIIKYSEGFTAEPIPEKIRRQMIGKTYHENPNISLDELSYLKVKHWNFNGEEDEGEIIVHKKLAGEVLEIFAQLFEANYQIEKIRLCDCYDGDDEKSMSDNNSSAFNYRVVANTDKLSLHAMGRAIDINPLYNPYIVGERVSPANSVQFCNRELAFSHKIDHKDKCYEIFLSHGWKWGGDWTASKDYQHFYKDDENAVKSAFKRACKILKR